MPPPFIKQAGECFEGNPADEVPENVGASFGAVTIDIDHPASGKKLTRRFLKKMFKNNVIQREQEKEGRANTDKYNSDFKNIIVVHEQ